MGVDCDGCRLGVERVGGLCFPAGLFFHCATHRCGYKHSGYYQVYSLPHRMSLSECKDTKIIWNGV